MASLEARQRRQRLMEEKVRVLSQKLRTATQQKAAAQQALDAVKDGAMGAVEGIGELKDRIATDSRELEQRGRDCERLRRRLDQLQNDGALQAKRTLLSWEARRFKEETGGDPVEQDRRLTPHWDLLVGELACRHRRDGEKSSAALHLAEERQQHEDGCVIIYYGTRRFMMRITAGLTFGEAKGLAAAYFGLYEDDFGLVDNAGVLWPTKGVMRQEFLRLFGVEWRRKLSPLFVRMRRFNPERLQDMLSFDPFGEKQAMPSTNLRTQMIESNPFNTKRLLRMYKTKSVFLRSFVLTLLYLLFVLLSLGGRRESTIALRINKSTRGPLLDSGYGPFQLLDYRDITFVDDIYAWLNGPVRSHLFAQRDVRPEHFRSPKYRDISTFNKIVGDVRLYQARVAEGSCSLSGMVPLGFVSGCYGVYSNSDKSTAPYWPPRAENDTRGFVYSDKDDLNGELDNVRLRGASYDGTGYVVDFDVNAMTAGNWTAEMERLRDLHWIDRGTRLVSLLYTVYSPNYDVVANHRFYLEISPGGSILPEFKSYVIFPDSYEDVSHFYLTLLDILILGLSLYFARNELQEYRGFLSGHYDVRWRRYLVALRDYCKDAWNAFELGLISTYAVIFFARIRVFVDSKRDISFPQSGYVEFGALGYWSEIVFSFDALLAFLLFIKLFQFAALSRRLNLIFLTIAHAGGNLALYFIMFCMVLFGWVALAHEIFGAEVKAFSELQSTFRTLTLMLIGPLFDYETLRVVNRVWAPVFYILFMVSMYFLMVNMFLAILNHSYRTLRQFYADLDVRQTVKFVTPWEVFVSLLPFVEEVKARLQERRRRAAATRRRLQDQQMETLRES